MESIIAGLAGKALGGKSHEKKTEPAAHSRTTRYVSTATTLQAEHPELFAAILEEGAELRAGTKAEPRNEGAEEERARITSGQGRFAPRARGPHRSPDVRWHHYRARGRGLVIEAEKAKRVLHLKAITDDAPRAGDACRGARARGSPPSMTHCPLEERCKRAWDRDPKLRAEFGDRLRELSGFQQGRGQGQRKDIAPGLKGRSLS